MTRYADPHVCPDCSADLPAGVHACPACGLLLRHALSQELFGALQRADLLLGRLRAVSATPAPVATAAPAAPVVPSIAPRRSGLRLASVPGVLLGLGALCLLVAAVIFLAVAWSWLGVGGRTAVLVALTAASAALGAGLARRGLRVAGESLSTVALGLLTLDVLGAEHAGWLGLLDYPQTLLAVGLTLLAASLAWTLAQPVLAAPQLIAGLGFFTAYVGATELTLYAMPVQALAVVAAAGLVALGRVRGAGVLPWVGLAAGVLTWSVLTLDGLGEALEQPTLGALWSADGTAWSLLASAALLLLPLAVVRDHPVRILSLGGALSLVVAVATLPVVDEGLTRVTLAALGVAALGALVAVALPRRWAGVPLTPAGFATLPLIATALGLSAQAASALLALGEPFSADAGTRVEPLELVAAPAVLVPVVAVLLLVALVGLGPRAVRVPLTAPLTILALAGVATLGLVPTPLWAVTVALLVLAGALTARGVVAGESALAAATAVLAATVVVALPSAGLTALVAAAATLVAAGLLLTGHRPRADLGAGLLLPVTLAGALWSLGEVVDLDVAARGLPVLVAVGLVALALPRFEVEGAAGLVALVAGVAAIGAATDPATSLALHLTVAGALVTSTSLLHDHRRPAAALGGLLLAAATWVRLADLGVSAPEAYTLPSATVLILLGLRRLSRRPGSPTAVLLPGLLLATVPSLLWVLGEPVSPRAVLLGGALLTLTLAGARLRWNAPLVVGAVGGAVLVLRELAPYAAQTPQWVLIGVAGALLTAVGVTWERRLGEVRLAADFLERLR